MAGTYTKKEFGAVAEEQTLLKDLDGTVRIVPKESSQSEIKEYSTFQTQSSSGAEPVRLSPGWEGTGRPEDELNFKGVTMDQADLELNPPKDRLNIVFLILLLHGIGALMPWNLFITARKYFVEYKLSEAYTGVDIVTTNWQSDIGFASQIPNLCFNWINIFVQLGGNLTTRIVWGLFVQGLVIIFTIALAMADSSSWPTAFYWLTMGSIVILNTSNGIYQNSVYGMAAKLPGKYTGAIILGSNLGGAIVAVISTLSEVLTPIPRTAAIYYFITALFIILACFDTYFALPINRFYRYHELVYEKQKNKRQPTNKFEEGNNRPPYWKILKQCAPQCFNVFMIFFVTLSIFPGLYGDVKISDENFFVPASLYANIMCFLTFNITAMLGSSLASCYKWPSRKFLVIPVLLRLAYLPLFIVCNYQVQNTVRTVPVLIQNDWVFMTIGATMGFTSGYFSSVAMVYCPTTVEPRYASTAGMFGAAFLITGIFSGLMFGRLMPLIVSSSIFG